MQMISAKEPPEFWTSSAAAMLVLALKRRQKSQAFYCILSIASSGYVVKMIKQYQTWCHDALRSGQRTTFVTNNSLWVHSLISTGNHAQWLRGVPWLLRNFAMIAKNINRAAQLMDCAGLLWLATMEGPWFPWFPWSLELATEALWRTPSTWKGHLEGLNKRLCTL